MHNSQQKGKIKVKTYNTSTVKRKKKQNKQTNIQILYLLVSSAAINAKC